MVEDSIKKLTYQKIQLLSNKSKSDVRQLMQALVTQIIFDSLENEESFIPLLGSFKIQLDENGNPLPTATLHLDDFMLKVLRQISENEETEIEKIYKKQIKIQIDKYLTS